MPLISRRSRSVSQRSSTLGTRDVRIGRLRSLRRLLRATRKVMRLPWLFPVALLLSISMWDTALATTPPTTTEPPSTTTTAPPSTPPMFDSFDPCETASSLSVGEWAACSSAYNVDKGRTEVFLGLWLLVFFAAATFVLLLFRGR